MIEETFFVKQRRLGLEVKIDTIHPEKSVQKLLNEEYFLGVENNELYQQNAFNLANLTTIKQKINVTSINKNKNNNQNNNQNNNKINNQNKYQKKKERNAYRKKKNRKKDDEIDAEFIKDLEK